jgi:hypothetical protein
MRGTPCDGVPLPKYTSQGIVYSILISQLAIADISEIRKSDPDTADTIWALLQEAKHSQTVLDSLSVKNFGSHGNEPYNVDQWVAQQRQGRNLWRLKIWELEHLGIRYRIVYALDPRVSRYFVLGVFDRDFNYDESDPRTKRVIVSYDSIGIPDYR